MKGVGFETPDGGGYFWIRYADSKQFKALHKKVLLNFYSYRRGRIINESLKQPTLLQSYYWQKYGSPFILKLLTPHITIGRLVDPDASAARKIVDKFGRFALDFQTLEFGVCEINHNTQVTKILRTFKLKK